LYSIKNIKIVLVVLAIANIAVLSYYGFSPKNDNTKTTAIIPNIKQLVLLNEKNTIIKEVAVKKKVTTNDLIETKDIPQPKDTNEDKLQRLKSSEAKIEATPNQPIEEKTVQEVSTPKIIPSSNNLLCYTIGPFEKNAYKLYTQNQLSNLTINSQERIILEKEISSYYLFIPQHKTVKAAKKTLAKLKQKKITDYYLKGDGALTNDIAVGLFSKEKHASRRYDTLKKLSFNVKMEVRYKDKKVYWLDSQAKESVINQLDIQQLSPLPLQLYLRQC
jgi:hypothetical protein